MAIRQPNIKNRTYYFYNDLINIKNFNINKLKLDKKKVFWEMMFIILDIEQKIHSGMFLV